MRSTKPKRVKLVTIKATQLQLLKSLAVEALEFRRGCCGGDSAAETQAMHEEYNQEIKKIRAIKAGNS